MLKTRDKCRIAIAYSAPMKMASFLLFAVGATGLVAFLPIPAPMEAAPPDAFIVTKLADTNDGTCDTDCSLREAIAVAGPNDTISFASGLAGTIALRSTLKISRNLTIIGPGTTLIVISGNNAVRVFYVDTGVHLTIRNLTVSRSTAKAIVGSADTPGRYGGVAKGGGLYSDGGIVTVINGTFSDNSATGGAGRGSGGWGGHGAGGALFCTGTLIVLNSTFSGNLARGGLGSPSLPGGSGAPGGEGMGGAIYSVGTLVMVNSTFSGNRAMGEYGGIGTESFGGYTVLHRSGPRAGYGGGIYTVTDTWVSNCTFVNNTASVGGAIYRPGVLPVRKTEHESAINRLGGITIRNTLIANSSSGGNCKASIISEGYNIDSDGTCGLTVTGDLSNTDPKLDMLKENGGPTFTHALLPGSPAINAGNPAGCTDHDGVIIATDQRGRSRNWGGRCDIGAFEFSGQ